MQVENKNNTSSDISYNISMMVLAGSLNSIINVVGVAKNLLIDETILGVKFHYGIFNINKGLYISKRRKKFTNPKSFYNQISIILNMRFSEELYDRKVNCKIFVNGSFQITGCKKTTDVYDVGRKLIQLLKDLDQNFNIKIIADVGFYLSYDQLLYTRSSSKVVGYFKQEDNSYYINREPVIWDQKNQFWVVHPKNKNKTFRRSRHIYNYNAEIIGTVDIIIFNYAKKFYNQDCEIYNGFIYHNNQKIIGKEEINLLKENRFKDSEILTFKQKWLVVPFKSFEGIPIIPTTKDIFTINVSFNIGFCIKQLKLKDFLQEHQILVDFKPEGFAGLNVTFKYSTNKYYALDGICHCSNQCTCINITFLIFQTGNINICGFKYQEQIDPVFEYFRDEILLKYRNFIS